MKFLFTSILALLLHATAFGPALAKNTSPDEMDHIIAVVNDDVVTAIELEFRLQMIKQQISKDNTRLPSDDVLRKQVLERMILEKIQLQIAELGGVRVDDETINRVIENIAKDNKLSMAQFRDVLKRDGMAYTDFRENIKTELIINQLQKTQVHNKINVTEREIDNFLSNKASREGDEAEYNLLHILIATPEAATPEQISLTREKAEKIRDQLTKGADFKQTAIAESDGPQALKGGDLGWRKLSQLPSFLSDSVKTMRSGQISPPLRSTSGFHLVKLESKRQPDTSHEVEQTLARHILIKTNQIISNDEARHRLETLRQRIIDGEAFDQLAQANSDDTGSAANGGSLGWFNQGTMVPKFEEEMNKLQPGEISQPFRTEFGWHIVQLMSHRKYDDSEQIQRNQARQIIGQRKAEEETQNWVRRLRSESYVEYRFNQ